MADLVVDICEDVTEVNSNQWDNLVEQSAGGSIFTSYAWVKAYEQSTSKDPKHVIVRKGDNPVGVLPGYLEPIGQTPFQRLNSSAPGHSSPLIVGDEDEILGAIQSAVGEICRGRTILHSFKPASLTHLRYAHRLQTDGYLADLGNCRMYLDLEKDWSEILDGMDSSKRKTIEKLDEDLHVDLETLHSADLDTFFTRYKKNMERHENAGLDKSFLGRLAEECGDALKLATGYEDETVIGQYLFLLDEHRNTVQHFLSAIDPANFPKNPGELLHSHMIQWGCDREFTTYDFGGTNAHWQDGVFRYKSEFGGDLIPTVEWQRGYSMVFWPLYRWARRRAQR